MQDPSLYAQIKPTFPEQEHLKCPRCDSSNTKFCYYNNYNLSQPRHFCKNCKRYWTKGGALRNIPVGGGTRKNSKRSSSAAKKPSSSTSSSPSSSKAAAAAAPVAPSSSSSAPTTSSSIAAITATGSSSSLKTAFDQDPRMLDTNGGNFSALLRSVNEGQFGNLVSGLSEHGSNLQLGAEFANVHLRGSGSGADGPRNVDQQVGCVQNGGDNSNPATTSCWNGGNGWPDLAIYTPGSNFQ